MNPHKRAERIEARLILRLAAARLNDTERMAIEAMLTGESERQAGLQAGRSRGAVWMAKQSGLRKLRNQLQRWGFRSSADFLSEA
jgi:DNA-directed RNA polymerase specialized sigma24 family protein